MRPRVLLALPLLATLAVPRADAARSASRFTVAVRVDPKSIFDNGIGFIFAHTRIGATCTAKVAYANRKTATIRTPPGAQHVGQSGIVEWSFGVGSGRMQGTATVTCKSKGKEATGRATFTIRPLPASPTPEPTATPVPAINPTYGEVNDHPEDWYNQPVNWTCVIAKFLGDDQVNSGNTIVGCLEYRGTWQGDLYADGEVILSVPSNIDTSSMSSGDEVTASGTIDHPGQGLNSYGGPVTLPQVQVTDLTDDGPAIVGV